MNALSNTGRPPLILERYAPHDPAHMRLQQPRDRQRISARLQHHLVIAAKTTFSFPINRR
jgi:hypothetical protein